MSGFYDALYPTPSGNGFSPYGGEQFGSESQGPSVGVIVGAAVGGTIGVIAIAAAFFFLIRASCRRRRAMRNAVAAPNVPLKECGFDDVALTSAARLYVRAGRNRRMSRLILTRTHLGMRRTPTTLPRIRLSVPRRQAKRPLCNKPVDVRGSTILRQYHGTPQK